jgi:predicted transcriptional regulator of viral defense system
MNDALQMGLSRYTLYKLRDEGLIEQVSRGVYRLSDLPALGSPDLVTIALRVPNAVICLISALSYHGLTSQVPHHIDIALPRSARTPTLDYPVIQVHRYSSQSLTTGVEAHLIDKVSVKFFSAEKTLADCFQYRNQIGMDVVLEALKVYRARKTRKYDEIIKYAKINRVAKSLYPYLEAMAI